MSILRDNYIPAASWQQELSGNDITYWWGMHPIECPYCHLLWKDMSSQLNLAPHWTGDCILEQEPHV